MTLASSSPLTLRIIALISLSLIIASYIMLDRTEKTLETALLDQTKHQAQVFLLGLESQLQDHNTSAKEIHYQELIDSTMARDLNTLSFSIYQIYFFDIQGKILAHSSPGIHPPKQMRPRYFSVFQEGKTLLSDDFKQLIDPHSGREITKSDIIIPFHFDNKIVAALELEIDIGNTLATIKTLDDHYEQEMFIVIALCGSITLFLIWLGIYRWLLSPITEMGDMAKNIAKGNLQSRLAIRSNDEVGRLYGSINNMADSIEKLFDEQERAHLEILQSLAKALEAKDAYTAGHSGRVAKFSVKLGRHIGLDDKQLKLLKQGALMHDLGKIGIKDAILNKPSALNAEEYEIMKQHPTTTAKIMQPLKGFKEFSEIAAWHHERWDGQGYPDKLKHNEIPLLARIVCIADAWDAMTGDRVYRKGIPVEKALSIFDKEKDQGQWDPQLVRRFIEMMEKELAAPKHTAIHHQNSR